MRILLTNDDGIRAEGIAAVVAALGHDHELHVIAPETQQSAKSHALTLHHPVLVHPVHQFDEPGVKTQLAIGGTPVDCVKLAMEALLEDKVDLILSGINQGPNLAEDVVYSGTVSAALEGIFYRTPSIAMSVNAYRPKHFNQAAAYIARHLDEMMAMFETADFTLNVNFPDQPQYQGTRMTTLGSIDYNNVFTKRLSPHGSDYYWIAGDRLISEEKNSETSDVMAVEAGFVSITPIRIAYQHQIAPKDGVDGWR